MPLRLEPTQGATATLADTIVKRRELGGSILQPSKRMTTIVALFDLFRLAASYTNIISFGWHYCDGAAAY